MSVSTDPIANTGEPLANRASWRFTRLVFLASAVGFLLTYQMLNDHFNRLARAREIAAYGEVPFRDFFDPGYFLGLYASAQLQLLTGHVLLADVVLDVVCMSLGATIVFLMTTDLMRSVRWGLIAAALVVLGQPRSYDFDKVVFLTFAVGMCAQYARKPHALRVIGLSALGVIAGLCRYDNAIYVGSAAIATIASRHWGDWAAMARRLVLAAVAAVVLLVPPLLFISQSAGLAAAADQIASYTGSGAERTSLFHPTRVSIDGSAPLITIASPMWRSQLLPGYLTRPNAAAWIYCVAMTLPLLVVIQLFIRRRSVTRVEASARLGAAVLLQMMALFVLREPIEAHAGAVVPVMLVVIAGLIGQSFGPRRSRLVTIAAVVAGAMFIATLLVMFDRPPVRNLDLARRIARFSEEPPSLDLMPDARYAAVVQYLRACTEPDDRLLVGWFGPELFVFAERGFAGRRGVVFAEYWNQDRYQRLTIDALDRQSVPLILMLKDQAMTNHPLLWRYVAEHYERVGDASQDGMALVDVWARRDRRVESWFGRTPLPCYAR